MWMNERAVKKDTLECMGESYLHEFDKFFKGREDILWLLYFNWNMERPKFVLPLESSVIYQVSWDQWS